MSFEKLTDEQFKTGQKSNWNSVAQGWNRWWTTFEQSAQALSDRLVDSAEVKPGVKVLDIATGVGEPAVTAARKMLHKGKVVAIDMSPEMLSIAKERAKRLGLDDIINFEESDAEAYPYPTAVFNAVISRWAFMMFPNFVPTMKKVRKSMVEDGILSAAVWSDASKVPLIAIPYTRIAKAVGMEPPLSAGSMGAFRFSDSTVLEDSLAAAGFKNVKTEKMDVTFTFKTIEDYMEFEKSTGGGVLVAMLKKLPQDQQQRVWSSVAEDVKKYKASDGTLKLKNEVIIATAIP